MIQINHSYLIGAIILLFLLTVVTRSLPFYFGKRMQDSELIIYLGNKLPTCILLLIAIYYVVMLAKPSHWHNFPWEVIAIGMTLLTHWRWRNVILSIFVGTGTYLLLNYLF